MTAPRFPEGNIILLYANHRGNLIHEKIQLPEHIANRIKVCRIVYDRILKSKPDGRKTEIYVISKNVDLANSIKQELSAKPLDEARITIVPEATLTSAMDNILRRLRKRTNIPTIYLITSHWQREICNNISLKFKEFKIHFEGTLDHRPIGEIDTEKDIEIPSKGLEFYKEKAKNKAVDLLLNHMFPDKENDK
jgi:hypothetical protein